MHTLACIKHVDSCCHIQHQAIPFIVWPWNSWTVVFQTLINIALNIAHQINDPLANKPTIVILPGVGSFNELQSKPAVHT